MIQETNVLTGVVDGFTILYEWADGITSEDFEINSLGQVLSWNAREEHDEVEAHCVEDFFETLNESLTEDLLSFRIFIHTESQPSVITSIT